MSWPSLVHDLRHRVAGHGRAGCAFAVATPGSSASTLADPATGRPRWLSKSVHGTRRFARQQLEDLVAEAGRARTRAGTLAELLDQWIEAASPGWSAYTVSHTRSIVECHLSRISTTSTWPS